MRGSTNLPANRAEQKSQATDAQLNQSMAASCVAATIKYIHDLSDSWNRFWFEPLAPHTLAFIRIVTGMMLLYMHAVWASDLMAFLGPDAWLTGDVVRKVHEGDYTWTYLTYVDSPILIWLNHLLMIAVALLFTVGMWTRVTAPLAWILNLMYCHRLTGHLFGLDQIMMMLMMYLMIAPCGAVYSLDAIRFRNRAVSEVRKSWWLPGPGSSTSARIATRLIQLHLCIIYLFGGVSKLRGEMWWDGTALWYALVNWEYQSIDAIWLGYYPTLLGALAHITIFWETFYCAAIWPRFSRPWALAIAFGVHLGIAAGLGMITFGLMMIVANLSFVSPETTQWVIAKISRRPKS